MKNKTICLNAKVDGKQPQLANRVYHGGGLSIAITTTQFFMGNCLIEKENDMEDKIKLPKGELEVSAEDRKAIREMQNPTLDEIFKYLKERNYAAIKSSVVDEVFCGRWSFRVLEDKKAHTYKLRIRKLTEGECMRLMGFEAKDTEACKKAGLSRANIYHAAGDSLVTTVMVGLLGSLLDMDYKSAISKYSDKLAEEVK